MTLLKIKNCVTISTEYLQKANPDNSRKNSIGQNKEQQADNLQAKPDIMTPLFYDHLQQDINNFRGLIADASLKPTTKNYAHEKHYKRRSKKINYDTMKSITSSYLLMTRSMGLSDEDALNLVSFNYYFRQKNY